MNQLEGYQQEKRTIDLVKANIFAILMVIPIVIVFGFPYYFIWKEDFVSSISFHDLLPKIFEKKTGMYYVILILGVIFHELIHGIFWARYAKNGFKSIKFGVLWKMLTPYCHCKEPLKVKHYMIGAIMPAVVLGLVPAIVSIIIGSFGLLILGMFFILAAGGDFMIINLLRKEDMENLVQDHPSEAGCYIYRKLENENDSQKRKVI